MPRKRGITFFPVRSLYLQLLHHYSVCVCVCVKTYYRSKNSAELQFVQQFIIQFLQQTASYTAKKCLPAHGAAPTAGASHYHSALTDSYRGDKAGGWQW